MLLKIILLVHLFREPAGNMLLSMLRRPRTWPCIKAQEHQKRPASVGELIPHNLHMRAC